MARPRAFDEKHVLEAAAAVFAAHGYAAASVDELVLATGLKRGSLYGAYGSKAGLFRAIFEHSMQCADATLLTDLLIVALWDRANIDSVVRTRAENVIAKLESQSGRSIQAIIFDRLVAKSCINY